MSCNDRTSWEARDNQAHLVKKIDPMLVSSSARSTDAAQQSSLLLGFNVAHVKSSSPCLSEEVAAVTAASKVVGKYAKLVTAPGAPCLSWPPEAA